MDGVDVLFVAHTNNDYDHMLPVIVGLINKNVSCDIIGVFNKYEVLKNRVHSYITKDNNFNFFSMSEFFYFSFFNRLFVYFFKHHFNRGSISYKFIVLFSFLFYNDKKLSQLLEGKGYKVIIVDHRYIDIDMVKENRFKCFLDSPVGLSIFRFLLLARKLGIPILMIPHGVQPVVIVDSDKRQVDGELFSPDFIFHSGMFEVMSNKYGHDGIFCDKRFFLGCPRFEKKWIDYLYGLLDVVHPGFIKPKNKLVILYLMDIFVKDRDGMDDDVLSVVDYFDDVELWVSHHPRRQKCLSLDNVKNKECVKQFFIDVDGNILIKNCDICISTLAGIFVQAVLTGKKCIFYDKWKQWMPRVTIFDDYVYKANDRKSLYAVIEQFKNDIVVVDDGMIDLFNDKVFDDGNRDSVERYVSRIQEIINV